jgi:DHA1 family tetracycline resistance protein-like MFS transporter
MQKRILAGLLPGVLLDLIGFAMLLPILPLYAEGFGGNTWQLMAVMGSYSATQFLAAPVLGRLSDRHGRRPLLLFCYVGSALSYAVFAVADSIGLLVLSRVLNGLTGGNIPLAQSVVADSTSPEKRTRAMGLLGMCFGLSFVIGPAVGGLSYKAFGPAAPGFIAAAFSLVGALLAWFLLPETSTGRDAPPERRPRFDPELYREAFGYPVLGSVLVVVLLMGVAFSTFETTFAQFLNRRFGFGPGDVGPVYAAIGIVIAVVQGGLIGHLVRRFGEERLIVFGASCMIASFALLPSVPGMAALFVVAGLLAIGGGTMNPTLPSLASRACPTARIGAMLGVFQATNSLGRLIGPLWGQFARGTFGEAFTYRGAALLMAVALVVAIRGIVQPRLRAARAG